MCPIERLPVLTKAGYQIKPSMLELSRMTIDQLAKVKNFEIVNSFGKVFWYGETDLVDVNLDVDVNLKPGMIEIYPDDVYLREKKKPEKG